MKDSLPIIICANPLAVSETFVRRHIDNLNLGNNIVFGETQLESVTNERYRKKYKPMLLCKPYSRKAVRFIEKNFVSDIFLQKIWSSITKHWSTELKGRYFLFEFGYIFVRHYDFALFGNLPFFVYFRGQDASSLLRQPRYVETLSRLLPKANGVVFVADSLRENLIAQGIRLPRTAIIPSGVETESFTPQEKKPLTAFSLGRFVEKKAHDDTLRALRLVADRFPRFHLILGGDGPLLENIKKFATQLGLEENITFTGVLNRKDVIKYMATAKYYIQSSKTGLNGDTEGFPSAIQEALSSGCVVCSTNHSGASDFLTNYSTALLCAEGNYGEMAENILSAIMNPELSSQIAQNGRSFAEAELDAKVSLSRFETFVDECLMGGGI